MTNETNEARDLALTPTQAATLKKLMDTDAGEMQRRITQGAEDANLPAYIDTFRAYYALNESKGIKTMPIVTRETRLACVNRMQWLYSNPENRRRIEDGDPGSVTTCDFSVLPVDAHAHPGFPAFRRQMDRRGNYPDHMLKSAWHWFRVGWDEVE